jgi:hypothetical protein
MPTLLPNKDELAEIRRALKDGDITDAGAEARAIKDFSEAKYQIEGVDSFVVLLREELTAKPGGPFGEHADLIEQAFSGKGSADARQKLLKAIGPEATDAAAKRFGLSGYADFRSAGKVPDDFRPKDKSVGNPWSPKYSGKVPADQERVRLIKTLGTKVATQMARAAGTDIAGRPLRGVAA